MTKLINFVFMVVSLVVIVAMVLTIRDLILTMTQLMGFGNGIDLDDISYLIKNSSFEEIMSIVASLGTSIFILFGFPLTIFLVCMNGLKK